MSAAASGRPTGPDAQDGQAEADLIERNGITRVRADRYHVDGYRYANLADALAQVRRGAAERGAGS